MLSDREPNPSSLSFSIAFFPQVFGRLVLLRGTPVCFRQNLHLVPCVRGLSGVGICLAGLIGCNRLISLHIFINIHILVFFCSVSGSTCVFCVDGPLSRVLLCPYVRERLSLSFPLLSPALRSKTPVVPPRSPRTRVATRHLGEPDVNRR